jgi:hypothetical protein
MSPSGFAETARLLRESVRNERDPAIVRFNEALARTFDFYYDKPVQVPAGLYQHALDLAAATRALMSDDPPQLPLKTHKPQS